MRRRRGPGPTARVRLMERRDSSKEWRQARAVSLRVVLPG